MLTYDANVIGVDGYTNIISEVIIEVLVLRTLWEITPPKLSSCITLSIFRNRTIFLLKLTLDWVTHREENEFCSTL